MLNQFVIVGRLSEIKIEEKEGVKKGIVILSCPRSFKNADGEYETDFIECYVFNQVAESTSEYCKKGDLIGAKGRIQSEDGVMKLYTEKITFLSNTKK